jgi:hypothetical protein
MMVIILVVRSLLRYTFKWPIQYNNYANRQNLTPIILVIQSSTTRGMACEKGKQFLIADSLVYLINLHHGITCVDATCLYAIIYTAFYELNILCGY